MPASSTYTARSSLKRATPPSISSEEDATLTTRPVLRKRQRKSRVKPKAPITQLTASNLTFKDIVHQLTGRHSLNILRKTLNPRPCSLAESRGEDYASAPTCSSMLRASDAQGATLSNRSLALLDAASTLTQALKFLERICSAYFPSPSRSMRFAAGAQDQPCKNEPEVNTYERKEVPPTSRRPSGGRDSQARATTWSCIETNSVPSPPIMMNMGIQNTTEALEFEGLSTRIGDLHQVQGNFLSLANLVKKHIAANSCLPAMISSLIHATN